MLWSTGLMTFTSGDPTGEQIATCAVAKQQCFSGWPVGYSLESHSALRAPVGRLHFTGEHTGSRFRSTVHAAYFAGKCQAKRLLRCLKDGQCDPYQPGTVTSICDEELNPGSSAATAKRKTWLWAVIMAVTSLSVIS